MITLESVFEAEKAYLEENGRLEEVESLIKEVQQAKFSVKDSHIPSLTFHLWEKEGILFGNYVPQKQRKLTLTELVWLKVISQLRELNMPLSTIKIVKAQLDTSIRFAEIINEPSVIDIMLMVTREHGISDEEVREVMNLEEFKEKKVGSNVLEIAIAYILMFRSEFNLAINKNGDVLLTKESMRRHYLETDPDFVDFLSNPHVYLSITKIVSEVAVDAKPSTFVEGYFGALSKVEQQILERCAAKDIELVTIKYSKGKPFILEVTEDVQLDLSKRLADMVFRNPFQSIKFNVQNGKSETYKCTTRFKLDS